MTVEGWRLPGLACPKCHVNLVPEQPAVLRCRSCLARYPILWGIPSFVPMEEPSRSATCELSVVLSAGDAAETLREVLPRLRRELEALQVAYEVLVVDGGSRDGSMELATSPGARVLAQPARGFGSALRTGFREAGGRYILTLDPDGAHDPRVLRSLWDARGKAEVVIASRYVDGGEVEGPVMRQALSRVFNAICRRALSLPVRDVSSRYRLYAGASLQSLALQATGLDILAEVLVRAVAAGYTVAEIPCPSVRRRGNSSRGLPLDFGLASLRTLQSMWKLRNSIASADYDARAYDSIVPLQRYWQRRRYRIITQAARGFESVLDVGCGSSQILSADQAVVGVDIQLHKLRYARRHGNPLVHGSIFALPFQDSSFDCVICSEVIEHIPADQQVFDELGRVLKPGGRLILGTPDYDRSRWRALEWLYARLAPGGYADEHITHYSRTNLQRYLESRGFAVQSLDYVCGAEMIFCLRKSEEAADSSSPLALSAGLRTARRSRW